jgi:hypothetical protein
MRKNPTNEDLVADRKELTAKGRVQVFTGTHWIEAVTPYYKPFIEAAKTMNGRWDKTRYCWVFPIRKKQAVLLLVRTLFKEPRM